MPRCRPPAAEFRRDDPAEEIEKPARRCVMQSGRVVMSVFVSILLIGGRGCPPPAESRWNETVKRWLARQGEEAFSVLQQQHIEPFPGVSHPPERGKIHIFSRYPYLSLQVRLR